jgi:uncharacterized protein YbaR (Trm112 family)
VLEVPPVPIDARVLEILCCPSCREALEDRPDGSGLECVGCHRVYPIIDGIPNLIVEEPKPTR